MLSTVRGVKELMSLSRIPTESTGMKVIVVMEADPTRGGGTLGACLHVRRHFLSRQDDVRSQIRGADAPILMYRQQQ